MKYFRIQVAGKHIIVAAIGVTIENGHARIYTTSVGAPRLLNIILAGVHAYEPQIEVVQSEKKDLAYLQFFRNDNYPLSIEEVTVTSVIPSIT